MEYSHAEWLKSVSENDGRQWLIEENPLVDPTSGQPMARYFEIIPDQAIKLTGGEGRAAKRTRKAREQLKKKTSKEAKPFVWQLGYNHCIGRWPGQDDYPAFSGSSMNRKKAKPRPPTKASENAIHIFSPRSRGKVKDKATAFYRSASGDRVFVTLTFIQDVTDKEGVQILNKFLTVLRKEKPGLQYLWVAEHQEESRSTIHFHVIMNRRLPVKRYNALWVLQQYNAGLIGKTAAGEEISREEIERRYNYDMTSKFKKKDPDSMMAALNPFDVERTYGVNGLAYYLTKYISKQKKKDPFGCLNWHCSRRVSRLFTKEVVSPSTFAYLQTFKNYKVDTKTGECFAPPVLSHQFFTMIYVHNKGAPLARLKRLENLNKWVMKEDFTTERKNLLMTDMVYRKNLLQW